MRDNSGQRSLEFDRKLGAEFIRQVPEASGIYLFKDKDGLVLYVGKAKNLKRRLSQYRLAPQKKAFRKMRMIVRKSASLEFRLCESEQEALLLENQLIQDHKPKLNVAGAFSFLYPYLGLKWEDESQMLTLCYTTKPELLAAHGFHLFGAFRSRLRVGEAYEALAFVMPMLGHHTPKERKRYGDIPFTRILCVRQIPKRWSGLFQSYFRGESEAFLPQLVLELLEKPGARQLSADIQLHLQSLKAFYAGEALRLRKVLKAHALDVSMIPQADRDRLFLSLP